MVNLRKVIKGVLFFLVGYIATIVLNFFIPPMIDALGSVFTNSDLEQISMGGMVLIWILFCLVIPSYFVINGLTEVSEKENIFDTKFMKIITAIIIFVVGMIFTVKAWYLIGPLMDIATDSAGAIVPLIQFIFQFGLFIIWFEVVIITPIYLIITSNEG